MKLPGIVYSLILAIAAWAINYFTTGNPGGEYVYAPILLAAIPVALKFISVYAPQDEEPTVMSRSAGVAQPSKVRRLLLG